MAGDLNATHEKAMKDLLILDAVRGIDSTGLVNVEKYGNAIKVAKQIGNPYELFDQKSFEKAMNGVQRVMIGHNRWATVGAISRNNAHPFDVGNLIGVHNGTIRNKWNLVDHNDFKVDSENCYHHIQKLGLTNFLDKADGAWAFVWWNKEEQTVNFLRNAERPLFICSSVDKDGKEDEKAMFWASEAWMLNVALSRHNILHNKPEMVQADFHFSIPVGNGGKLAKGVARRAESTFRDPYQYQGSYNRHQQQQPQQKATQATQTPGTTSIHKAENAGTGNVVELKPAEKKETLSLPKTQHSESSFDRFYLKQKAVLFEVLEGKSDEEGEEYLILFDGRNPYKEVRVYPSIVSPIWDFVGGEVQADLYMWTPYPNTGKGYYTVKPDSVRVLVSAETSKKEETWRDSVGKEYTEAEFKLKYKTCSYCTIDLVFGDGNKVSRSGECFCPDCANNEAVKSFVNF